MPKEIKIDREREQRLTEAIHVGALDCLAGHADRVAEWLAPADLLGDPDTAAYLTVAILRKLRINGQDLEANQLETALFERTCAKKEDN